MTQASRAPGLRGVGRSEAGAGPGPACGYWDMRAQGRHALTWIPRAVAVGALRFSVAGADLRCDWFRMARAGLRFQAQAAAVGQQPPSPHAGMALAELSAADDAGHSYRLRWDGGRGNDRLWMGEVVAEPMSAHERPDDVAWFELAAADGPAARVVFAPPPAILVRPAAPPWPTPAESYLAWLSRQVPAPELGRSGGREVVAAVAEALVSVGAMPAQSLLLPPILGRHERSSHPDLPLTWPHPVRLGTPPDFQIALCAALPFEHAAAVIEGLSAWGEDIQLHIYGWPWSRASIGRPRFPPSRSAQSMISAKSTKGRQATGAGTVPAKDTVSSPSGLPCRAAQAACGSSSARSGKRDGPILSCRAGDTVPTTARSLPGESTSSPADSLGGRTLTGTASFSVPLLPWTPTQAADSPCVIRSDFG